MNSKVAGAVGLGWAISLFIALPVFGQAVTDRPDRPAPSTRRPERPDDPPGRPAPWGTGARSAPVARGTFVSVQVNRDPLGNNIPGDAANEPSIAVDPLKPQKMAIGWRQFDTVASNFRQAGVAHTLDGGQTWIYLGVLDPGQFRSDPVLASDAVGNFYYMSLSSVTTAEEFKSTDSGVSWPTLTPAFGGDKEWMTIDRTNGIGSGNIYEIWNVQFSCCGSNDFTRSTDGGLSFEGPFALPQPSMKWGTLDVGPDGTLYAAGASLDQSVHLFTKSTTARDPSLTPTFAPVQTINLGGFTTTGGPNPSGLLGQVWVATDHSNGPTQGNLYVLGSVNPPGSDPLDVMFIRSEDDGATWSAPVRINDDPFGTNAYQWLGTLAVAPNGRIDVVWLDTRLNPNGNFSELYYAYSLDAGVTWTANIPLTPAFNHTLGYPNQNKMGDYFHMVSMDSGANLAYAATFNGEQDVYFLHIAPDCNGNGIHDGTDVLAGTSLDCNGNAVPDDCEFPGCPGILPADMNCDGALTGDDIQRFVDVFTAAGYTCQADMPPQDGIVDDNDVAPFVAALIAAP
ncbi:MAG: sialidase family protein [Phycisphaerae bacterium]